ncbi:Trypsin domain containing protein, partial [Asbolus verrucosus]
MLHVDDDVILCTMFSEGGYQPCKGDSGGPLVCEGVVIGVVSWGVECNIRNKPAVFGRVDAAIDFINNTLK